MRNKSFAVMAGVPALLAASCASNATEGTEFSWADQALERLVDVGVSSVYSDAEVAGYCYALAVMENDSIYFEYPVMTKFAQSRKERWLTELKRVSGDQETAENALARALMLAGRRFSSPVISQGFDLLVGCEKAVENGYPETYPQILDQLIKPTDMLELNNALP